MSRTKPLPPDFESRAFTAHEGILAGITRRRMRAGDLARPFYGVRVAGAEPDNVRLLCEAFHKRMEPDTAFSHQTAARLYGLPLPRWAEAARPLHVTVVARRRSARVNGVVGHEAEPGSVEIWRVADLRVVSPADCWRQLSTVLPVGDLVVLGDGLVRRVDPLATVEQLHEAVRRHAGRRGVQPLRLALDRVRPGTDSPQETRLRLALVRRGLPEPEVNGIISDENGAFVALGDLVYRRHRVLIEYDGGVHREDERQYHHDIDRLDAVMGLDWRVVRINKTHMRDDAAVAVRRVRNALRARGWRP